MLLKGIATITGVANHIQWLVQHVPSEGIVMGDGSPLLVCTVVACLGALVGEIGFLAITSYFQRRHHNGIHKAKPPSATLLSHNKLRYR